MQSYKSLVIAPGIRAKYKDNHDGTLTVVDILAYVSGEVQSWKDRGEKMENHYLSTLDARQAIRSKIVFQYK